MGLNQVGQNIAIFFKTYPLAGFGLFLAVVFLLLMNRRDGYKLLVVGLLLAAILVGIGYFGKTLNIGLEQKDKMSHKTERALK